MRSFLLRLGRVIPLYNFEVDRVVVERGSGSGPLFGLGLRVE